MKFAIRIFVDGYETTVQNLKKDEIACIKGTIYEYIQTKNTGGTIELNGYSDQVMYNLQPDFMEYSGKKIHLNPFGFHKPLDVIFEYINANDFVCYCGDMYCDARCGTLNCGCIDVCRNKCGLNYDSY